jgi:hypothetical protein
LQPYFFLCSLLVRAAAIIRLTNQAERVRPPNGERRGSPKTDAQDISKRNTIINPAAGNFMLPETAQGVDLKYSLLTTCRTPVLALRIKRNSRRIDSMENSVQS